MKKAIIYLFCIIFVVSAVPATAAQAAYNGELEKLTPYSDVILLASMNDGTVIFSKNADMQTPPASLTKIVVAAIVLEKCADLNVVVTVPEYTVRMFDNTDSSTAGLKPGEEISLLNLLYCLLVPSANEAAAILADHVSQSMEAFVALMNTYVEELGCENTHFLNVHGLDEEGQYTTANDMLKIVNQALTFPLFEQITGTSVYTVPATNLSKERKLVNTNFMMNKIYKDYYFEYVKGIKTGSTDNAGKCVISKASKDGYSYIAVIMRAPFEDIDKDGVNENGAFLDCKKLFEWTFKNIRLRTVAEPAKVIEDVPVKLSWSVETMQLVPEKEVSALVPSGNGADTVMIKVIPESLPGSVDAPITQGQVIAQASVLYADEEIARINLVAKTGADRSIILYAGSLIKKAVATIAFKIAACLIVLLFAAYIALTVVHNVRKKKKKRLRVVNFRDVHRK